jgi:glycerol-3-phosphate dehydrogenase
MPVNLDAVIFGGGVAGLWLLDVLRRAGHRVLLLEADRLGAGQTGCSQGIIHGGLKYALDGVLSPSASAISEMPDLWRQCLSGRRQPDLTGTRVRAERCYLWRTGSLRSRAGMLGARLALRATPRAVAGAERPPALAGSAGTVVTVDEPVIDPVSLVGDLAGRHGDAVLSIDVETGLRVEGESIILADPGGGRMTIHPRAVVLAAGAGNAGLIDRLGLEPRGGPCTCS